VGHLGFAQKGGLMKVSKLENGAKFFVPSKDCTGEISTLPPQCLDEIYVKINKNTAYLQPNPNMQYGLNKIGNIYEFEPDTEVRMVW
jgi:hypothetical protein